MISDHEIIGTRVDFSYEEKIEYMYTRTIDENSLGIIIQELIGKHWETTSTDVNVVYKNFIGNISATLDEICPIHRKILKKKPWINREVTEAQKVRNIAYKKFIYTQ